jgi:hypothetical protein
LERPERPTSSEMSEQEPPGTAAESGLVERAARLCGAQPNDSLLIAGRGSFDVFLAFCRHGYSHACYATRRGPRDGDDADLLYLTSAEQDGGLDAALAKFGRSLRPGGAVLARLAAAPQGESMERLRRSLAGAGFSLLRQQSDGQGALVMARKLAPAAIRRAA